LVEGLDRVAKGGRAGDEIVRRGVLLGVVTEAILARNDSMATGAIVAMI
jgi:hypothetical protein